VRRPTSRDVIKQLDEAVDVTPVDFDSTINDGHFTPNHHHV
jgi:hypothetical protein